MNVKEFLHTWCEKQKVTHTFEFSKFEGRHRHQFKCEAKVKSYSYIGIGYSSNKKDAQRNAARAFIDYLVRERIVQQSKVQGITKKKSVRRKSATSLSNSSTCPAKPADKKGSSKSKSVHLGKKRKLKEYEDRDYDSILHGNWTMEIAKCRLHQFLEQNKIKADYEYSEVGADDNRFCAEMKIFLKSCNQYASAKEHGSDKQMASKSCALSMVRQLYHMGLIKAFKNKNNQTETNQVPLYEVAVSPEVEVCIDKALNAWNINPVQVPLCCKEALSLITHTQPKELVSAPNKKQKEVVFWSPPQPDWNPWKNCNINEGPLLHATMEQISEDVNRSLVEQKGNNKKPQTTLNPGAMFPIQNSKDHIFRVIKANQVVLIRGETGCGKSMQVPQFILEGMIAEGKGADCSIIVTQPKTLNAISFAERVAMERNENLGQTTGYSVRFEKVLPRPHASILYCTVGTLLRQLENGLCGISHVIVDEIHQRDVETDFLLVLLRDMLSTYSDLRIVLMSAIVDVKLFTEYFGNCIVIDINGCGYPIQDYFLEDCIQLTKFVPSSNDRHKKEDHKDDTEKGENCNLLVSGDYLDATKQAMAMINEEEISFDLIEALLLYIRRLNIPGAILIVLPVCYLIFALQKHLEKSKKLCVSNYRILPLDAQMLREDQKKVFEPTPEGIVKIILSTNVVESNVFIDDVVYVIDCCKEKLSSLTSNNNVKNFAIVWASKTSLEQRRACAGRVKPGFCFRFCSKARYERLQKNKTPEIFRTPLHGLALSVKMLRLGSLAKVFAKAVEPPPKDAIIKAQTLLKEMRALDANDELTPLGRILARLPIEPRLGKMVIYGYTFNCGDAACIIAASTAFPEPFIIQDRKHLDRVHKELAGIRSSDHLALLEAFQLWEDARKTNKDGGVSFCEKKSLLLPVLCKICDAKNELQNILMNESFLDENLTQKIYNYTSPDDSLNVLTTILCAGFDSNITYQSEKRNVPTAKSMQKSQKNCINFEKQFSSPFYIISEKYFLQLHTQTVSSKQMTTVTPLQLLLFASCPVVYEWGLVILDDWIRLKIKPNLASKIVALRRAMEALILRTAQNPPMVAQPNQQESALINVVRMLSQPNAGRFGISDQNINPPKKKFAKFCGGKKGSYGGGNSH